MANDRPLYLTFGQLAQIPTTDFIDPGAGVQFPNGSAGAPSCAFNTTYGWFYDSVNTGIGLSLAGTQRWVINQNAVTLSAVGGALNFIVQSEGNSLIRVDRYSNDAPGGAISARKARGTIAAPSAVLQNDLALQQTGTAYDGVSAFPTTAQVRYRVIEPTPGPTAMGGRIEMAVAALGAVSLTEVMRLEAGTGMSMFGANPVIDQNRTHVLGSSATSALPTNVTGGLRYVSDLEGGQGVVYGGSAAFRNLQNGQIAQSVVSGQGILSRFTGYCDLGYRGVVNNTMQMLNKAGLLTKLLGLWVHAVPTNSTDALLNWVTPGTRNLTIVGSPTWTANQGFTGDGTSGLLYAGAMSGYSGVGINAITVGAYVLAAGTGSAKAVIGQNNVATSRRLYLQSFTSGALVARCQDTTNDNYTPSVYTGMFALNRSGSTTYGASVDDGAATTITRTSNVAATTLTFLGTVDSTASEFSNAQLAFSFISAGLTATDLANLRWIMRDYYLVQVGALAADYTVATLPLATTPPKGSRVYVTDGLAPVFSSAITGGGAIYTPVYTDSSIWRAG